MRRREIVAAALKETALRSTVRLPTGPPVRHQIVRFIYRHSPPITARAGHFVYA